MAAPALKPATYQDVLNAPSNVVAELVDDTLYTHPRPRTAHARSASVLGGVLFDPFDRGRGGPGGWLLLFEPELHLGRDVLVPDIAGWRRARMPVLPDAPAVTLPPDWVCEVLSPSTASVDRTIKLPVYAAQGVAHVWFVDTDSKTLEVLRLDGRTYRIVGSYADDARVTAEPFEGFTLDLSDLWSR